MASKNIKKVEDDEEETKSTEEETTSQTSDSALPSVSITTLGDKKDNRLVRDLFYFSLQKAEKTGKISLADICKFVKKKLDTRVREAFGYSQPGLPHDIVCVSQPKYSILPTRTHILICVVLRIPD